MIFFRIVILAVLASLGWVILRPNPDAQPSLKETPESEEAIPSLTTSLEGKISSENMRLEQTVEKPVLPETPETPKNALGKLAIAQIGAIQPLLQFGEVYLAGQPSVEDFDALEEKGVKTILNLRKAKEISWDEQAIAAEHGMKYVHLPFQGPDELTSQIFDEALEVLRDENHYPVCIHCGSSNRVGAIWYVFRILDGNLSHEEAAIEAKAVGLRTAGYLKKAKEYLLAAELLPAVSPKMP